VETLTPSAGAPGAALASDPYTAGAAPAGLAWIYNRRAPLHPYIHYYDRRSALSCTASGRDGGIWYVLEVLRRCDTLQRGAGSVIAACVGLLFAAVEYGK